MQNNFRFTVGYYYPLVFDAHLRENGGTYEVSWVDGGGVCQQCYYDASKVGQLVSEGVWVVVGEGD